MISLTEVTKAEMLSKVDEIKALTAKIEDTPNLNSVGMYAAEIDAKVTKLGLMIVKEF